MTRTRKLLPTLPILCSATFVHAHGLMVECTVEPPDQATVFVHWADSEPASGAAIRVTDADGNLVADGTTSELGTFVFTAAKDVVYTIDAVIAGHSAECRISQDESARRNPEVDASVTHEQHGAQHHDHAGDRDHDHAPLPRLAKRSFPAAELFAGVALILAVAALTITRSLRRELRTHIAQHGRPGK